MKPDRISDAISQMDEDLIEEYFETKRKLKQRKRMRIWQRIGGVAAACFVLLIGLPLYLTGRNYSTKGEADMMPGNQGYPGNLESPDGAGQPGSVEQPGGAGQPGDSGSAEHPNGSEKPGSHLGANTSETEEKVPAHDGLDGSEDVSGTEDSETETEDDESESTS